MTESDRDKTLEVMARADADLLPQIMALIEEYATAKSILTIKAERGSTDGYALVSGQASAAYRKIGNLLDSFGEAHLAALQASGMAVVPSGTELALAEAVGHIALLTAFWMETPGWTHAAEAAREFIGGVPIDWKAERPEASAEGEARSTPLPPSPDKE